jgi:hypothetical protein
MENLAEKMFNEILNEKGLVLNEEQKLKFQKACVKAIQENQDLNYENQKFAARKYLDFILDFPQMSL